MGDWILLAGFVSGMTLSVLVGFRVLPWWAFPPAALVSGVSFAYMAAPRA